MTSLLPETPGGAVARPHERSDRGAAAVPLVPSLTREEEGFETFRETFLLWVTDPHLNRALRVAGTAFHDMVLEHSQYWPDRPGLVPIWDLRAALGDLRHIQGFLAGVGREPENSELDPVETSLCAIAAAEAQAVAAIADRIEQRLADHAVLTLAERP
jgi:hypothetical protein